MAPPQPSSVDHRSLGCCNIFAESDDVDSQEAASRSTTDMAARSDVARLSKELGTLQSSRE